MRRSLAFAVMALLLALPARAQTDSGQITLAVTDQSTKTPIGLARVVLDGPVIASELTGPNGQVLFTEVPDGIYRARVAKSGYQRITSAPFEVVNGRYVTVNVSLAIATDLKLIGTVTAHSSAIVSTTSIGPDSAQRKLSNDLAGALNKLSGVSVSTSGDDSDATQTVSLEGHDASQTQLSLDGIPLNAPGSAGNLGAFATDLFGGASVHSGPQIGGLGGGVSFSTLQPTLSWLSTLSASAGSNGRNNYSFGESGSFGKLGVAAQTTYRANPSLVDGSTYLDASGLDYSHDGDSAIYGNLVKLRYQATDSQTLVGSFLNSDRTTNVVCLRITSSIPCGYGPGNSSDGNVQLYSLTDSALVGETSVQAAAYSSTFTNELDELNRFVDGAASPIGYATTSQTHGFTLNAALPARERHTISFQGYGTWSDAATTPLVAQAIPYYNGTQNTQYAAFQATDTIRSNDKLSLSESFGASRATASQSSVLGSLGAVWRPTTVDTLSASYALGGVAASPSRSNVLTDPASLRFDCNGKVAYGNAPGDQPSASSSTSARIGYTRALRGGSIGFQMYRQIQNDVVLPVDVNGSALLALGTISPAYIAAVEQIYNSSAGCGTPPGTPFGANQLYMSSPISGVERIYEGGSLTGYVTVGNLVVQPYYNLNVSKALSSDPRIANPYSITISGQQLPNIPLQKAGVVFDYKSPHSSLEWLADAQYTAKNNPNNLPAYATYDAGVSANLTRGTLTVAASNITNAYAGIFASPAYAVPYLTQAGTSIPTIARPLTPRTYSLTYAVKFGPGAAGISQVEASRVGPGGGPDRGGGFRRGIAPLPSSPPANPLDLKSTPLCTADAQAVARTLSDEIKAYVTRIEAAKAGTAYPQTMPSPQLDDATIVYHGLGTTYALSIVPKFATSGAPPVLASSTLDAKGSTPSIARTSRFRAFFGCLQLHVAQPSDVAAQHLFEPPSGVFAGAQITFMPSVGLYVVARQQQAGAETFRVYALPSSPPADPFTIRTAAACTPEIRPLATDAAAALRAYFATGTPTTQWTIVAHQSKGGTWYALQPLDPAVVGALITCGRVAAATPQDVIARGYDGVMPPNLNYAKALGLYLIRPARPTPQPSSAPQTP